MVFLGTETFRLAPLARGYWDLRSTHPADLPTGINVLRIPRAVNAHALAFPLRHTVPRMAVSFSADVFRTVRRGTEASGTINRHPLTIPPRYRNVDLLSIDYAFRPRLRTD